MSYIGDFVAGATNIECPFNTHKAFGEPITLAGSPAVKCYKTGSLSESTAGITLIVDHDSVVGKHKVLVDTSADGTFYAAGYDYELQITAGTVDGVSVVGTVVGKFSIENRSTILLTPANKLFTDANGRVRSTYPMLKNATGSYIPFEMFTTAGARATGVTVTVTRSIDGATSWSAATGTVEEVDDGAFWFMPSAADLNGSGVIFKFAATGCDPSFGFANPQA